MYLWIYCVDYVENFAKERNIKYVRDKMHNIVLFKEATKGYEDHETVMLEGHMDMVCEKNNDSDHDFSKDSIELIEEDGFLHANKTTLGADDGVGVCYMLALLDDESLKHPALECVFTVQEEVGLNGAMGLDKSILKAKKMIGLDRGKEKIITVSCSGGRRAVVEKGLSYLKNESPCYQLYVGGLQGGHSGGVIHLERGNANVIMTRVYYHLSLNNIEFLLGSFKGGLKDNAIPRECVSVFASNDDFKKIKIRGEITNFNGSYNSGHYYFSLKDKNSSISCVMFKLSTKSLDFEPKNGVDVVASGEVSFYKVRGNLQFRVRKMQEAGLGDLYIAFEKLKKKLDKE